MDPQKYLNEHFKKIKLIHKTDSTEIWLAFDNSTNEKVAIKIMSKIGLPYENMLDIDHPNLPKIYYAADDGCITYVVEEYLTGMNLFDYIKQNGKFDEKIAIIGAGPAGLSAAYYLAVMGFTPTVFEKNPKLGGMMMYGIPKN